MKRQMQIVVISDHVPGHVGRSVGARDDAFSNTGA
jgi:hypothetical protein